MKKENHSDHPFGISEEEWMEYNKILAEVRMEFGSVKNALSEAIKNYQSNEEESLLKIS